MNKFMFGKSSQSNMVGLEHDTVKLCNLALEISDYDFGIIDGYRTEDEQLKVFLNGKSEVDGNKVISAHQLGLAVDVLPAVRDHSGHKLNMWNYDDPKVKCVWYEVHRAFLRAGRLLDLHIELGLTYNISGSFDYPHIQINKKDK